MFWRRKSTRSEKPAPTPAPRPHSVERRRHPREDTTILRCELGEVTNVSATGFRVHGQGAAPVAVGTRVLVTLESAMDSMEVAARIVRIGIGRWGNAFEAGLEFVDLEGESVERMLRLARAGVTGSRAGDRTASRRVTARIETPDFYAVLGIARDATGAQIQTAYRTLARQYHPDMNKSAGAGERFTQIAQAYAMLRDPEKRKVYDMVLSRSVRAA